MSAGTFDMKFGEAKDQATPSLKEENREAGKQSSQKVASQEPSRDIPSSRQIDLYLKLLGQFQMLREEQKNYNGNFGLFSVEHDHKQRLSGNDENINEEGLRGKRWAVYVTRAVYRYTVWWDALKVKHGGEPLKIRDMAPGGSFESSVSDQTMENSEIKFEQEDLPPLDILLVWSTHMLSPRAYLEDCLREGLLGTWFSGLPWLAIESSFKNEAGAYQPGELAAQRFQDLTGLEWTPTTDHIDLTCPVCRKQGLLSRLHSPLTTCGEFLGANGPAQDLSSSRFYEQLNEGTGYADPQFFQICGQCDSRIDHSVIQIASFENDLQILKDHPRSTHRVETDFLAKSVPLRGSILDIDGLARNCSSARGLASDFRLFPNRLLASIFASPNTANAGPWENMEAADEAIRNAMMMPSIAIFCQNKPSTRGKAPIYYNDCVAMDKTMAAYWNNPGPFSVELVRSVVRQGTFADEVLHAMSTQQADLSSMAASLGTKYIRFMQMVKKNEDLLIAPTLEVDIVWHTHQLSPQNYYDFSNNQTGKFIEHPYSVPSTRLASAFKDTCQIFRKLYGEPYSTCDCGCAEDTKPESKFSKLLGGSKEKRKQSVAGLPNALSHMSTHNSVASTNDAGSGESSSPQSTRMIGLNFKQAAKDAPYDPLRERAFGGPWAGRGDGYAYAGAVLMFGTAI